MAFWQGDAEVAVPLLIEADERFKALGDEGGIALCRIPLGFIAAVMGETEAALERLREARHLFAEVGDAYGQTISLIAERGSRT